MKTIFNISLIMGVYFTGTTISAMNVNTIESTDMDTIQSAFPNLFKAYEYLSQSGNKSADWEVIIKNGNYNGPGWFYIKWEVFPDPGHSVYIHAETISAHPRSVNLNGGNGDDPDWAGSFIIFENGSNIIVEGINIEHVRDFCISFRNCHDSVIRNCSFSNLTYIDPVTYEDGHAARYLRSAISLEPLYWDHDNDSSTRNRVKDGTETVNCIIENNCFHNIDATDHLHSLYFVRSLNNMIRNNITDYCSGSVFKVRDGSNNNKYYDNKMIDIDSSDNIPVGCGGPAYFQFINSFEYEIPCYGNEVRNTIIPAVHEWGVCENGPNAQECHESVQKENWHYGNNGYIKFFLNDGHYNGNRWNDYTVTSERGHFLYEDPEHDFYQNNGILSWFMPYQNHGNQIEHVLDNTQVKLIVEDGIISDDPAEIRFDKPIYFRKSSPEKCIEFIDEPASNFILEYKRISIGWGCPPEAYVSSVQFKLKYNDNKPRQIYFKPITEEGIEIDPLSDNHLRYIDRYLLKNASSNAEFEITGAGQTIVFNVLRTDSPFEIELRDSSDNILKSENNKFDYLLENDQIYNVQVNCEEDYLFVAMPK